MIVALRAARSQPQPYGGDGVGPVDDLFEASLIQIDAGFDIGQVVAQESSGDTPLDAPARQQIACKLLDCELVERNVLVKSLNHPIAITPGPGAKKVSTVAVTFGVARQIEPETSPLFPIMG